MQSLVFCFVVLEVVGDTEGQLFHVKGVHFILKFTHVYVFFFLNFILL